MTVGRHGHQALSGRARPGAVGVAWCLAVLVALVAGCGDIDPTEPVKTGPAVARLPTFAQASVIPDGPRPDDGPDEIVRGFLLAAGAFADNHEVARSFLTERGRSEWRSDTSVTIYPQESTLAVAMERLDGRPLAVPSPTATGDPVPSVAGRATPSGGGDAPAAPRDTSTGTPSPTGGHRTQAPRPTPGAASPGLPAATDLPAPTDPPPATDPPAPADLPAPTASVSPATARTAQVRVTTPVTGTIDSHGTYLVEEPRTRREFRFDLVRDGTEWRIDRLRNGVLLLEKLLTPSFRPLSVYFFDPSATYLVSDLRWFPSTQTLSTSLVEALLAGPSAWLKDAVRTGVPDGTQLNLPIVPQGGVATVDLSPEARQAGPRQRRLMADQISATLGQIHLSVRLTVQRAEYRLYQPPGEITPGTTAAPGDRRFPAGMSSDLVVVGRSGRLERLGSGRSTPVPGVSGLRSRSTRAVGVSLDGRAYAVLTDGRDRIRYQVSGRSGAGARTVIRGKGLTPPSFDPFGRVWSAPSRNQGWVLSAAPGTAAVRVRAAGLRGYQVLCLRLSWDGSRAVAVVRRGGRYRALLLSVLRDQAHQPLALGEGVDLLSGLVSARDIAWADPETVFLLGRRQGSKEQPWRVTVGGFADPTTPVVRARGIAARIDPANRQARIHLGMESGEVYQGSGSHWSPLGRGRWPVFPG